MNTRLVRYSDPQCTRPFEYQVTGSKTIQCGRANVGNTKLIECRRLERSSIERGGAPLPGRGTVGKTGVPRVKLLQ